MFAKDEVERGVGSWQFAEICATPLAIAHKFHVYNHPLSNIVASLIKKIAVANNNNAPDYNLYGWREGKWHGVVKHFLMYSNSTHTKNTIAFSEPTKQQKKLLKIKHLLLL